LIPLVDFLKTFQQKLLELPHQTLLTKEDYNQATDTVTCKLDNIPGTGGSTRCCINLPWGELPMPMHTFQIKRE